MARGIRMADIAKQLGVSTVAVSKALGNQRGVSEELREKIKKTAEDMGYELPAAYRNKDKKVYNIGILVSSIYIEKYVTFYWEFYQLLLKEAAKADCFLMLEVLELEDEKELRDAVLVQEERIDGLIVLGRVSKEYLKHLKKACHIPVIYMDFYYVEMEEDCIISNSFYGIYKITNYLFSQGHEKIAFVGTLGMTDNINDRYLGYQKAMMEHGKEVRTDWCIKDREDARRTYTQIEIPDELPTAFVCNCDVTAGWLIKSLNERGIRVPQDVSVVGYDDYLFPGICDVELTTYSVDRERMAMIGIDKMRKKIEGEPYQEGIHVVEGKLIERASVLRCH